MFLLNILQIIKDYLGLFKKQFAKRLDQSATVFEQRFRRNLTAATYINNIVYNYSLSYTIVYIIALLWLTDFKIKA